MKKTQKTLGIFSLVSLMIGTLVTTASAATIGDPYTVGGYHIGYIFIAIGILIGVAALVVFSVAKKGKALKFGTPVTVAAIAFLLVGAFSFTDVAVTPADVTADVTWDVTCASGTDDITIDNDGRTITKLIWADVDLEVINGTDDAAWSSDDDPWLNFTISPSLAVGVSSTTNQGTTRCSVLTPDQDFTEDSTEYDLFEDASTGGDKNLVWTTDGTDDYESKLCTVTIGGSETAALVINFLDDGLSQFEAGESQSFQISVGGIVYTMTIIVTALT